MSDSELDLDELEKMARGEYDMGVPSCEILTMIARIRELEAKLAASEKRAKGRVSVPPLTNCEMCGEANCCEGEWMDGSEIRCLSCGNVGAISAHEHSSGYTFWILSSIEEPDEEEAGR